MSAERYEIVSIDGRPIRVSMAHIGDDVACAAAPAADDVAAVADAAAETVALGKPRRPRQRRT